MAKINVNMGSSYTGAITAGQSNSTSLIVGDVLAQDNVTIHTTNTELSTGGVESPAFLQIRNTDLTSSVSMSLDGGSTFTSKISPASAVTIELLSATTSSIYLKADLNPAIVSYILC